jgi:hypothetical protein
MNLYDVFNGDADGITSLVQLRLAEPLAAQCTAAGINRALRKLERPSDHAPVTAELAE